MVDEVGITKRRHNNSVLSVFSVVKKMMMRNVPNRTFFFIQ